MQESINNDTAPKYYNIIMSINTNILYFLFLLTKEKNSLGIKDNAIQ